jgi:hypothetical protein
VTNTAHLKHALTAIFVLLASSFEAHDNPLVIPPQEVVERLWRAATEGELLTAQGWKVLLVFLLILASRLKPGRSA